MSVWEDSWTDYAVKMAVHFKEHREDVFYSLSLICVPNALEESYKVLVKNKTLSPIETLPQHEKQRLWNLSGSFKKDKAGRITVSHCLYLLEQLLNQKL